MENTIKTAILRTINETVKDTFDIKKEVKAYFEGQKFSTRYVMIETARKNGVLTTEMENQFAEFSSIMTVSEAIFTPIALAMFSGIADAKERAIKTMAMLSTVSLTLSMKFWNGTNKEDMYHAIHDLEESVQTWDIMAMFDEATTEFIKLCG